MDKTGTSSSYRDAWFIGFTGALVTGVWVGYDDFRPMSWNGQGVTGGSLPATIWHSFMSVAHNNIKHIPQIPGLPLHPNQIAEQQRLSELLHRASVKDALEIEKELHRVTEELERLEGQMKVLKDRLSLSTITVRFQPRGAAIQSKRPQLPFPWLGSLNLANLLSLSEDK